ncbi:helix-turn-helix domain-containing protein [Paenibacillus sp. OAS669]|uniref:helix-turn-helix domain-containing protein n=1 Tax=Paenibacillus sp. OAS669 TaxID=2663821 RepID=UPI00298EEE57|nr:helix-turn-helix domain-containing protein [Paenibacillus sp. OAS669]
MFQYAPDAMVIIGLKDGKLSQFVTANDSFLILLGCDSICDLFQLHPGEMIAPENGSEMVKKVEKAHKQRTVLTETVLVRRNRTRIHAEIHMSLVPERAETFLLCVVRDISERKWIEAHLRLPQIIGSGLLSEQLTVERLTQYVSGTELSIEHFEERSLVHFTASEDIMRIRKKLRECAKEGNVTEFIFSTLVKNVRRRRKAIICPFYRADGQFRHFAFVLLEVRDEAAPTVPPALKLQMLMIDRQMSLLELSRMTGISKTTLSKLRNGKINKPHAYTKSLVARALGVEESDIWDDALHTL